MYNNEKYTYYYTRQILYVYKNQPSSADVVTFY